MATIKQHRLLGYADGHCVHSFVFSDAEARGAAMLLATDLGRIAFQMDTKTFWVCTDPATRSWQELGGGSGEAGIVDLQAAMQALAHPAGYVPASEDEIWFLLGTPDSTAPEVTAFAVAPTSASLVVPVSSFTATDAVGVAAYIVTESGTPPLANDPGWMASAPTQVTASGAGAITFYGYAKDAAGNVSTGLSSSCTITLADTTAPTVDTFVVPATADNLTVAITSATASDAVGVTHGMITESATAPLAGAAGWVAWTGSGALPAGLSTYTTPGAGAKTLRLWAKDAAGNVSSALTAACTFTLTQAATPTFLPVAGTYVADQSVTISCGTAGATIHYTTDGSTPTDASPTYSTPIAVSSTTTIKAFAVKTGLTDSAVASATFTLQCATPTFNPPAGTYSGTQSVTISTTTSGAEIRYTTDGSDPTGASTLYTGPISVAASGTLKAIAIKTGRSNSAIGSAVYTIQEESSATFFASGTLSLGTGTGNVAVTGLAGRPKVLIMVRTGSTIIGSNFPNGHGDLNEGWAIGTLAADQITSRIYSQDGANPSVAAAEAITGYVLADHGGGRAALASFDANGFTLSKTIAFAADYKVMWFAIGGNAVSASLKSLTTGNMAANDTVQIAHGLGAAPALMLTMGGQGSTVGHASFMRGAATEVGEEHVAMTVIQNGASPSVRRNANRTARCATTNNGVTYNAPLYDFSMTGKDATNITLTANAAGNVPVTFHMLFVSGISAYAGERAVTAGTNNVSSGEAWTPKAVLSVASFRTDGVFGSPNTGPALGYGVATNEGGTVRGHCADLGERDGWTPSDNFSQIRGGDGTNAVTVDYIIHNSVTDSFTLNNTAYISAFTAGGFTLVGGATTMGTLHYVILGD